LQSECAGIVHDPKLRNREISMLQIHRI
jgi:hypothetical protein